MPYTLYYHTACKKIWGRGTAIVLTLEAACKDYEIKLPDEVPQGVGFAVPMLTMEDGVTISQLPAILDVLGEEVGLNGKTKEDKIKSKQYLLDINDIVSEGMSGKLTEKPERAEKWFKLLDSRLSTAFFLGDEPTTVDFFAFMAFSNLTSKGVKLDPFPKLSKWWDAVQEITAVKKMKDSGIPVMN
jgi:glutathione S-transferase